MYAPRLGTLCAQRTVTRLFKLSEAFRMEIHFSNTGTPEDCANAIVWPTSDQSSKTSGAVIPVDGGLTEAFLR